MGNDRLTKFMSLAKVLEDAVDRAVKSSKEATTLGRRLGVVEADVASLAKDLANDKAERPKALERVVRQAEVQMTGIAESLQSGLQLKMRNDNVNNGGGGSAASGAGIDHLV